MVLRTENIVELKDVLKAVPPGARDGKKRLIIVMEILQGVRDPSRPNLLLVLFFVISSSQGLSAELAAGWVGWLAGLAGCPAQPSPTTKIQKADGSNLFLSRLL